MTLSPSHPSPITSAAALGIVAGMRSQLPLALLALAAREGRLAAPSATPLGLLRLPAVQGALGLSAVGELIVDKLPFVPSRHELGPLVGRTVFGGVAGAALLHARGRSALTGALIGAAAAGVAADGAYHVRVAAGRLTGLPDPLLGAVEDALAILLGLWATRAR